MSTILVTGATGAVGRHLIEILVARGDRVVATTRSADTAGLPADVAVVEGDFTSGNLPEAAFTGVAAAFVFPAEAGVAAFVRQAAVAGVPHLVVVSSLAAAGEHARDEGSVSAVHHRAIEACVESSGIPATIIRPGTFAGNLLAWAHPIRSAGTVFGPYPTSAQAPIHEADVADVAAAVLADPSAHAGAVYAISGPEALTRVEQLDAIGAAIGRDLTFAEVGPEQFRESMQAFVPEGIITMLLDHWRDTVDEPDTVRPTEPITGRPARTLAQWAVDHADDFR